MTTDDSMTEMDYESPGFVTVDYEQSGDVVYVRHGRRDGKGLEMARLSAGRLHIIPNKGTEYGDARAYDQIVEINLPWHQAPDLQESPIVGPYLAELPDGLGRSFHYGMRLPVRFRCIISAIEDETDCKILCLTNGSTARIRGDRFELPIDRFSKMVEEIEVNRGRAQVILGRIRKVAAENAVAEARGRPQRDPTRGRKLVIQKMTDAIRDQIELDEEEENDLIAMLIDQADISARRNPEAIGRLRNDLDLVTLEVLLERFRLALDNAKLSTDEPFWQDFFQENLFVLQQLFGAPVVSISEKQLQVRAAGSGGRGARIVDFLLANALTGEGFVVEIKTPAASLMHPKAYRGEGSSAVFGPHRDLADAVAQLQSQKESLRVKLGEKLNYDDPLNALKHASPRGALIVGTVGGLQGSTLDSFRRYRDGLHDVMLVGFDEVAERLQTLLDLLRSSDI